jgi:2-polyprenyl-6-methoxyphenol hydroxylase-like FAD-dependent oxidoreductase
LEVRPLTELREKHVAVLGGSVAGLLAAVALARDGHRVTVVERDAAPLPASPDEAFASWERRGSPQTRQSHAFLARLHNLLAARAPDLLDFLLASGAERMRFADLAARVIPDAVFTPEDEEITMLACRRITFEWALRRYIEGCEGVTFRDGVVAEALLGSPPSDGKPLHVSGVHLAGEPEPLRADLVVDATGRRTQVSGWLAALDVPGLRVEREPCGIFYASRFYRLHDAAEAPPMDGPMGADLGYLKYGTFPGDARVFSITLAASPDDAPLRAIMREPAFDALAALLPATAPWVHPAVATPITPVAALAGLENLRRFPVEAGSPRFTGLALVGDALIHTNPIVGRGCTLAAVNAFLLADALRDHPDDPAAFAMSLDAAVQREIAPWYESVRIQDRNSIEMGDMQRRGDDPFATHRPDGSVDPRGMMRAMMRDGFLPALREDVSVLRAFMRIFNLLEKPVDLMKDARLLGAILASYGRRDERDAAEHGPDRDAVVAHLGRLAASAA